MTDGLEVLVQLVIAAITTDPFSTLASGLAATATAARPLIGPPSSVRREIASGSGLGDLVNAVVKLFQTSGSATRSCGRLGPGRQGAGESHAYDDRRREVRRLAENRGLRLDPAGAPTQDAETVDHRRVGVGPHQGVGDRDLLAAEIAHLDDLCEVLEVDLVADAHARRYEREVMERLLRPTQERVALAVALDLLLDVARVRIPKPE